MLSNLFSGFDPGLSEAYSGTLLFFLLLVFLVGAFLPSYYLGGARLRLFSGHIGGVVLSIFKGAGGRHLEMGGKELLGALFCLLLSINMGGLVPWVASLSSQFAFTLSLGLPLWVMCVIGGWTGQPVFSASALIGTGLPVGLGVAIGMIELGSLLIRPLTLSLRLMANMVAGHVLLSLAWSGGGLVFLLSGLVGGSGLLLFEVGVGVIQSYVFVLLLSVYLAEWGG